MVEQTDADIIDNYITVGEQHQDITDPLQTIVADVDHNGEITSNDSVLIIRNILQGKKHKDLEWDVVA
ncbi:MAG: hypothetical protein IKH51_02435 [Clostridia bacterium]|nr:hypothetical protein [Clostridia bacterium]